MKKQDRVRKDGSKAGDAKQLTPRECVQAARRDGLFNVTLVLNHAEVRSLAWWHRHHKFTRTSNISHIAHWLLLLILQRPALLTQWLDQMYLYCTAEDIPQLEFLRAGLAKRPELKLHTVN